MIDSIKNIMHRPGLYDGNLFVFQLVVIVLAYFLLGWQSALGAIFGSLVAAMLLIYPEKYPRHFRNDYLP